MKIDATVIIPTYNRAKLLELTLRSLVNNGQYPSFEVIVVDDGSEDDTKDVVEKFSSKLNIRYFFQQHKGFRVARARNIGINNALGEITIFLDCGVLASKNFIMEHTQAHSGNDVVIGYVVGYDDFNENEKHLSSLVDLDDIDKSIDILLKNRIYDMRETYYSRYGEELKRWRTPWCIFWTANVSIGTIALKKIGGFDEKFVTWGGEDTELGINLFVNRLDFKLSRRAIALHYPHDKEKVIVPEDDMRKRTYEKRQYVYEKYGLEELKLWMSTSTFELNNVVEQHSAEFQTESSKMV